MIAFSVLTINWFWFGCIDIILPDVTVCYCYGKHVEYLSIDNKSEIRSYYKIFCLKAINNLSFSIVKIELEFGV